MRFAKNLSVWLKTQETRYFFLFFISYEKICEEIRNKFEECGSYFYYFNAEVLRQKDRHHILSKDAH